jgi:hypothetical protein
VVVRRWHRSSDCEGELMPVSSTVPSLYSSAHDLELFLKVPLAHTIL